MHRMMISPKWHCVHKKRRISLMMSTRLRRSPSRSKVAVRLRISSFKDQQDPRQISSFGDRDSFKDQQKSTSHFQLHDDNDWKNSQSVWHELQTQCATQPRCFMIEFFPKCLCKTICSLKDQLFHVRIPRLILK